MKATDLLEQQHRKVEAIFTRLESGKGDRSGLVTELANNLAAHMVIEQEIFYPAVKNVSKDLILESFEEHAIARFALARLIKTEPGNASFAARVTALKELIAHHVDEEEQELFPKVETALGDALTPLGERMKARFEEALEDGYEESLVTAKKANATKARKVAASSSSSSNGR